MIDILKLAVFCQFIQAKAYLSSTIRRGEWKFLDPLNEAELVVISQINLSAPCRVPVFLPQTARAII